MYNSTLHATENRCRDAMLFGSFFMDKNLISTTTERIVFISNSITISWEAHRPTYSEAYETMLASEDVLRREWESPEEDEAWADL